MFINVATATIIFYAYTTLFGNFIYNVMLLGYLTALTHTCLIPKISLAYS